jgi:phage tail sheath protein FI
MPVQVSYPGVYIQEIPSGVHTITEVATANTAFIGRTLMGPVNQALTLTSMGDYQRAFGAVVADSAVSQAVSDFYQNGGGTSIVVRLFNPDPSPAAYSANLQTATDAATAVNAAAAKALKDSKDGGKTSAEAKTAAVAAATPVAAQYATNPGKAAAQQVLTGLKGFDTTAVPADMTTAAAGAAAAVKSGADAVKTAVDGVAPTDKQPQVLAVAQNAAKAMTTQPAAMAASRLVLVVADLASDKTGADAKTAVDAAWIQLVTDGAEAVNTAATGASADAIRDAAVAKAGTLTGEAKYGGDAVADPLAAMDLSIEAMTAQLEDAVEPAALAAVPQVTAVLTLAGSAPVTTVVNAGNTVATAAALAWLAGGTSDAVVQAAQNAAAGLQTSGALSSAAAQAVALAALQAQSVETGAGTADPEVAKLVMQAAVGAVASAVQEVLGLDATSQEVVETASAQKALSAAWTAAPGGAMAVQQAADGAGSANGSAGAALVQQIDTQVNANPTTVTAADVCTLAAAGAAAAVSGTLPALTLQAASPGDWPNGVLSASADYADITEEAVASLNLPAGVTVQDFFNLSVGYAPVAGAPASERFPMVSVNPLAGAAQLNLVLAAQSNLLRWTVQAGAARPGDGATGTAAGGVASLPLALSDYLGSQDARTGIYALETVDLFNLMSIPPDVPDAATGTPPRLSLYPVAAKYCRDRRAFLIIDPPAQWTTYWKQGKPASIKIGDLGSYGPEGENAAVYFPDLTAGRAPSGALAGIYGRTDIARGVWKAPAGTADGGISGSGLQLNMTDAQNGMLNPQGINALRTFPAFGSVVWGARTLKGADAIASDWKYVPVRRLALHIEESLYRGTQWAVFEPNDEPLWASLRLNVGSFMNNLFRKGAFQGKSAGDAYYVRCDASTTTQNDIDLGIVNVIVGFAPLKPAEFVILSIAQIAGKVLT